jgi:hypothetical protein
MTRPWFGASPQDRRGNPNESRGQNTHDLTQGKPRHRMSSNYKPLCLGECQRTIPIGDLSLSVSSFLGVHLPNTYPADTIVYGDLVWANDDDHSIAFDIDFRSASYRENYYFCCGRSNSTLVIDDQASGGVQVGFGTTVRLKLEMYDEGGVRFDGTTIVVGYGIMTSGILSMASSLLTATQLITASDPQSWESDPVPRTLKPHAFSLSAELTRFSGSFDITIEKAAVFGFKVQDY